jgi:chaperonin GroES
MPTTEVEVKIQPLADRVVLEVIGENEQTAGGIYIPDSVRDREKPQQGIVLFVGPGRINDNGQREEMQVKVGDKVLFAKYSGTDVKLGSKEVKVISEKDILAILVS